jgi:hypothetical protein
MVNIIYDIALEILWQLLCNVRRHCDISQGLRHAIPRTQPQPYAKFGLFEGGATSLMHPLVIF